MVFTSPFGSLKSIPHVDIDFTDKAYFNVPSPLKVIRSSEGCIDSLAGVWSVIPPNTLRVSDKGALFEEQRTNPIRNNSMQGAIAGSPGTLPTYWDDSFPTGLTRTISLGIQNGIDYIEINWVGTTTSAGAIQVNFEAPDGVGQFTTNNDKIPVSAFASNASAVGITSLTLFMQNCFGNNSFSTPQLGPDFHGNSNFIRQTTLLFPAWSGPMRMGILTNSIASGIAVNVTVRIGWPQLELPGDGLLNQNTIYTRNFVTSPIRTTGSAVTRQIDIAMMVAPPTIGTNCTVFAQATPQSPTEIPGGGGSFQTLVMMINTDYYNDLYYTLQREPINGKPCWQLSSSPTIIVGSTVWSSNTKAEFIGALSANSQVGNFNGGSNTTATVSASPANPMTIYIGSVPGGSYGYNQNWNGSFNGYIHRVSIWAQTRLDDTLLSTLTGTYYPEIGQQKANQVIALQVALSSEVIPVAAGVAKVTMRAPHAFTITGVSASLAIAGATPTVVDVNLNGSSIFSTNKLTIDSNARTSVGSTTVPTIITTSVADDDEFTFDIDTSDVSATGLKIIIKGNLI